MFGMSGGGGWRGGGDGGCRECFSWLKRGAGFLVVDMFGVGADGICHVRVTFMYVW